MVIAPVEGPGHAAARTCAEELCGLGHKVELLDLAVLLPRLRRLQLRTAQGFAGSAHREAFTIRAEWMVWARAQRFGPDLVLIAPDAPLGAGVVDRLRGAEIVCCPIDQALPPVPDQQSVPAPI